MSAMVVSAGSTAGFLPASELTGSLFAGWYTEQNGGGSVFLVNTPVIADITVYARWVPKDEQPFTAGGVTMDMVFIPAGTMVMGGREGNFASTVRTVTLTKSFYMGKYEVTQEQYQAVMGANPSYFNGTSAGGTLDRSPPSGETQEKRPVEMVSWYSTLEFCNKLSMKQGLTPVYRIKGSNDPDDWGAVPASVDPDWSAVSVDWSANGYRLPTEAEWEYACRAGTTTGWNFGDDVSDIAAYAWVANANDRRTHQVGKKKPNEWGLYDMHGNVYEWCWDWFHYPYGTTPEWLTDPKGGDTANSSAFLNSRILRGGSWNSPAYYTSSTWRYGYRISNRSHENGFRVVRNAP